MKPNHSKNKKIKLILLSIAVLIFLFVLYTVVGGKCIKYKYKNNNQNITLANWMASLDDNALINNVVIPGSHDSGCYDMVYVGETQKYSFYEQLMVGVRYFDIRINKLSDDNYVIYHSIINGKYQAENIFKDLSNFLKEHNTEFLILDFQHFSNDSQARVYELVNTYFKDMMVENNTELSDLAYIDSLKVKDVRGKCIILFGENSSYCGNNYIFSRNDDSCSKKNQVLDSYYVTEINGLSSKKYIETGLPFYIDKIKEKISCEEKGLFVLQSQLTDTALIFGPWSKERSHEKNMSKYINNLKDSKDLELINIIMRDFINEKKTKEIINLNYYKNIINNKFE